MTAFLRTWRTRVEADREPPRLISILQISLPPLSVHGRRSSKSWRQSLFTGGRGGRSWPQPRKKVTEVGGLLSAGGVEGGRKKRKWDQDRGWERRGGGAADTAEDEKGLLQLILKKLGNGEEQCGAKKRKGRKGNVHRSRKTLGEEGGDGRTRVEGEKGWDASPPPFPRGRYHCRE